MLRHCLIPDRLDDPKADRSALCPDNFQLILLVADLIAGLLNDSSSLLVVRSASPQMIAYVLVAPSLAPASRAYGWRISAGGGRWVIAPSLAPPSRHHRQPIASSCPPPHHLIIYSLDSTISSTSKNMATASITAEGRTVTFPTQLYING